MNKFILGCIGILGAFLFMVGGVMMVLSATFSLQQGRLESGPILFSFIFLALGVGFILTYRIKSGKAWKELLVQLLYALTFWT
jgi:hypothetical protein